MGPTDLVSLYRHDNAWAGPLTAAFVGCQSTSDMGSISPAAVSECGAACEDACTDKAKSCGSHNRALTAVKAGR